MFSRQQQLRVFTLITVFVALAQASWFNSNPFRREVVEKKDLLSGVDSLLGGLGGGSGGAASSSTPSASSDSSESTTSTTSTSSTPTPTPTPSSSSTPSVSSSTPTHKDSSISDTPKPTPTPTPTATPSDNNSQSQVTTTQITFAPGQTSSSSPTATQSSAKSSNSATVAQNESSSSTMSAKTKSTVVGVVVGIGGAIVLAGLAIVAFRIWGRRKNEDDSDGLMGFRSGSAGHEKSNSSSGNGAANPFQSTLENYHNPARNVNASSNF